MVPECWVAKQAHAHHITRVHVPYHMLINMLGIIVLAAWGPPSSKQGRWREDRILIYTA